MFLKEQKYMKQKIMYISIFGRYKDCYASFRAHSVRKLEADNGIKLFVEMIDTRRVSHKKKRHLMGN